MIELASSWFKLIQIVFCSNFELSRVTMTHRLSRLDAGTGRGASCLPLGIPGGYHEAVQAATKFWFLKIQGNMASTKRGRHRGRTTVICIKQLSFMLLVVQCLSQSPLELFQAKTPRSREQRPKRGSSTAVLSKSLLRNSHVLHVYVPDYATIYVTTVTIHAIYTYICLWLCVCSFYNYIKYSNYPPLLACTSTISLPALINWSCVSHPTIQKSWGCMHFGEQFMICVGANLAPLDQWATSCGANKSPTNDQAIQNHTKSSQSITKSIWCSASDAKLIRVTSGAVARSQGSIGRQVRPWPAQVHSAWCDSNVKDIQRYNSNQFYIISHTGHGCCVFADD